MPYINKNVNECHFNFTKKVLKNVISVGAYHPLFIIWQ